MRDARDLLWHQIWYNRHRYLRAQVEAGDIKITPDAEKGKDLRNPLTVGERVWQTAKAAGESVATRYEGQLGPWDDFEWGMLNGN